MVCRRVRRDSSSGSPTAVLQPFLSPTRLRASPWFRTRANDSSAACSSPWRNLDRYRLRAQRDRTLRGVRPHPRPAHVGATGGPQTRDVVRSACGSARRSTFQCAAATRLQDLRCSGRGKSVALGHRCFERARSNSRHARRDQRASHRSIPGDSMDQTQRPARGLTSRTSRIA